MNWKNTAGAYGAGAKGFHWALALLVIGLLALGLFMTNVDVGNALKFKLFFWHKSFGITVLFLVALRLGWRLYNKQPGALPGHKKWEKRLAKFTHFFLYFAMFTMPLSGWIMSSAKHYSVSVFGWFTLPHITPESKELARAAVQFHETMAWIFIALVALHVAGAIKHHVIDKDDTLRRMLPPLDALCRFCKKKDKS